MIILALKKSLTNKFMLKSQKLKGLTILYFVFLFPKIVFTQHQITKYEYCWAFCHPFSAVMIKKKLPQAMMIYKFVKTQKTLDTVDVGGKLDAFRHIYTMAYLSKFIQIKKLRKLGKAHEKGSKYLFDKNKTELGERSDSLACVMDLRNNELGFEIGEKYKNGEFENLTEYVINQIMLGKAWYLKKSIENVYVDCQDIPIKMENYQNVWFVPKCLIATNL